MDDVHAGIFFHKVAYQLSLMTIADQRRFWLVVQYRLWRDLGLMPKGGWPRLAICILYNWLHLTHGSVD